MGSYLTVVNDTDHPWDCRVGSDMKALKWATIGVSVVAATAACIGLFGVGASSLIALGGKAVAAYTIFGVPLAAMSAAVASVGLEVAVGSFTTGVGIAIAQSITKILNQKGYDHIGPSKSKRYGKMSLSLWQQSLCVKTTIEGTSVTMDTLYMRPIFSGATEGSNRHHSIQHWIKKHGTTRETIQADSNPAPIQRLLQNDQIVHTTI